MYFEAELAINRTAEHIWPLLTDVRLLAEGGFGIRKLEGTIALAGRLKLWSEVNPGRAFSLKVTGFGPPRLMVWEGGMPFGLFSGVRRFTLDEAPGGATLFRMREDYSGLLLKLIGKSIPDLNPSFEKFAQALKRAAEGR